MFRSPLRRITINSIQKKESKKEAEDVHARIISDRKFLIDAAVVKILKANRTISHVDLVSKVLNLVRFPLDIDQLKARFKYLMKEEYMKRADGKDHNEEPLPNTIYNYIA